MSAPRLRLVRPVPNPMGLFFVPVASRRKICRTSSRCVPWRLPVWCFEAKRVAQHRQPKRLNALRTTLGPYARQRRDVAFALHSITRTARAGGRK